MTYRPVHHLAVSPFWAVTSGLIMKGRCCVHLYLHNPYLKLSFMLPASAATGLCKPTQATHFAVGELSTLIFSTYPAVRFVLPISQYHPLKTTNYARLTEACPLSNLA
jgi:hypothetical protein